MLKNLTRRNISCHGWGEAGGNWEFPGLFLRQVEWEDLWARAFIVISMAGVRDTDEIR